MRSPADAWQLPALDGAEFEQVVGGKMTGGSTHTEETIEFDAAALELVRK
jgi:hypothetical protein